MIRARDRRLTPTGFTLVELAVVTAIIAIFLTLGLGALNASRESQALSTTNQKQATLKDALIGYLRRNGRLPCPDDPASANFLNGVEKRVTMTSPTQPDVTTPCSTAFGLLPYVTLGVAREAVQDGWGNFFSYHVSSAGVNTEWTRSATFRTGNTGALTVNDRVAGAPIALSTTAVALILSHGTNGFGAYTLAGARNTLSAAADEAENTNADSVYFKRSPTTDDGAAGGAFDDVVMYLAADDLLGPLFKDGTLKPPIAAVNDGIQKIRQALIGYAMSHGSTQGGASCTAASTPVCRLLPWADNDLNGTSDSGTASGTVPWQSLGFTTAADVTNPWTGLPFQYIVAATAATTTTGFSTTTPGGTAVTVTASDGVATTITVTVSFAELINNFVYGSTIP